MGVELLETDYSLYSTTTMSPDIYCITQYIYIYIYRRRLLKSLNSRGSVSDELRDCLRRVRRQTGRPPTTPLAEYLAEFQSTDKTTPVLTSIRNGQEHGQVLKLGINQAGLSCPQ